MSDSERILVVSPYPPLRDGLANYSVQMVSGLRAEGHHVEVVSPQPSAAAHHERLKTFQGLLRTAARGRRADRVIVQFHPEIFLSGTGGLRFVWRWLGLMLFFSVAGRVEVIVHETPHQKVGPRQALLWARLWSRPAALLVHTEPERMLLINDFGVAPSRIRIVAHGERFEKRTALTRAEARAELGIDSDAFQFLCIGFLQPHKGFDRAADALAELAPKHLRLDIVGEVRVHTPEHDRYVDHLRTQSRRDSRVVLHEGYVSDEEFDRWIVSSDAVVLPYRGIWSSGVAERAALYERHIIVTDVGGLADQVGTAGTVVANLPQLVAAMADVAGVVRPAGPTDAAERLTDQPALQAAVRDRAARLQRWHDPLGPSPDLAPGSAELTWKASPLVLPPVPGEPGLGPFVQRVVRRLTRWEQQPVVDYINGLRRELLDRAASKDEPPGPP